MQPGYGELEGSFDVCQVRAVIVVVLSLVTQPFEGIDTVADIISYSALTHSW